MLDYDWVILDVVGIVRDVFISLDVLDVVVCGWVLCLGCVVEFGLVFDFVMLVGIVGSEGGSEE